MCFDICTINIRVSIRVRGLHLVLLMKEILFHHDLLDPPGSGWGSGACLPSSLFFLSSGKGFCSIMICWFLLVLAGVPVLVSLLLSSVVLVLVSLLLSSFFPQERGSVPSWFAGSCWSSSACLPSSLFFGRVRLSLVLSSFLPQDRGSVPSWNAGLILLPAGVPVLVSLLLYSLVPVLVSILSSFLRTGVMICWCFLVLGEVPVLVSILLSSFFLRCIGVSSITGHLAMAWENTAEKTIHSVDAISQPRSFRALAEPDRTMLVWGVGMACRQGDPHSFNRVAIATEKKGVWLKRLLSSSVTICMTCLFRWAFKH